MKRNYSNYFKILLFLMLISCLSALSAFAQENKISGTIIDEKGDPLIGANVIESGTTNGVMTNIDGKFVIVLGNSKSTLLVSYIGYKEQVVTPSGDLTNLKITLLEDLSQLDEVVVVGYGTQRKKDLIGSVGSASAKDLEVTAPTTALQGLQGRISGVQITTNSGSPGAGSQIRIRGLSTFEGGVDPLFIVDGQPVSDIDYLNPSDIETLDILKDGASAAIYGSQAANGVVLVTTKRGKEGNAQFKVDFLHTAGVVSAEVPHVNTSQRIIYEQVRGNTASPTAYGSDPYNIMFQRDVDWQAEMMQTSNKDRVNMTLLGGSEKTKYYVNVGYENQSGIVILTGFNRLSTKINLDVTPQKWLSAGTSIGLTADTYKGMANENSISSYLSNAIQSEPFRSTYDYDGSVLIKGDRTGNESPVTRMSVIDQKNRKYRTNFFQYLEVKPISALSFRATFGANLSYSKYETFTPAAYTGTIASGKETNNLSADWIQEDFFTWKPELGGAHHLTILGGLSMQYWKSENNQIQSALGYATDIIHTLNNATSIDVGNTYGRASEHSLVSQFARLDYNFKGKYLASATIRRDGSSRFGENNQYGFFPAGLLGWRFSDEPFINLSWLSNGKLRATYAITGNERISDYGPQTLYVPGKFYNGISGIGIDQLGNDLLGWEQTAQMNLGIDLGFIKNKIVVNADYYEKTTSDLLYQVPLPLELPVSTVRKNIGSIKNTGFEVNIQATIIDKNDFYWEASFNIARNWNEVLELAGGVPFTTDMWKIEEGQPIGNFFGYVKTGVYAFNESNAYTPSVDGVSGQQLTPDMTDNGDGTWTLNGYTLNGAAYTGTVVQKKYSGKVLAGGDVIMEDLNGDDVIDNNDRKVIGNGQPKHFGGFSSTATYKAFTLSVAFDYNLGQQLFRDYEFSQNKGQWSGTTASPEAIDLGWRKQGDVTDYPSLGVRPATQLGPNTFYLDDGSYIKWRNLRLNYQLPKSIASKLYMDAANIYLSVNNLITWTNYKGYDPEQVNSSNPLQIGKDQLNYPRQREFLVGLNVTF